MTPAVPKPPKREPNPRKRPRAKNAKRANAEHLRAYGSPARIAFVKSLPCCACGVVGFSEVAHVGNGGAGRKADSKHTVPLCGAHGAFVEGLLSETGEGCHAESHRIGIQTFAQKYQLDLPALAEETERSWQAIRDE